MLPLFLIVFIDLVGFGIMMPLLPYYATRFGASEHTVSLLFAMYSIGQFVAAPFWGRLSDRFGRRIVLITSLCGSIVSYIVVGMADALWVLFAARLFAGLMAGNISAAFAYIADITTPENRAKGMGAIGAAFGLGFIFGPAIGGILAGSDPMHADFATPSFTAAGLSALALSGVAFRLKESLSPERRALLTASARPGRLAAARAVLGDGAIRRLILIVLLTTAAMGVMETSFTIWIYRTYQWGPSKSGEVFAFIGVLMAAIQGGLIGRLTRRFGEANILVAGACLLAAGLLYLALPVAPVLALVLLAAATLAVGYGLSQPSFNSLISKAARASETGLVLGVSQSASSLARVIGPLLSSLGFAYWGLRGPFLLGTGMMVPALILAWRLRAASAARTGTQGPASGP